jgi:polyferredoxin
VPGFIENVYRLQIMNTDESARSFTIAAEGMPNLQLAGVDQPIAVGAAGSRLVPLRLQVPAESGKPGANSIVFVVRSTDEPTLIRREKATFMLPR